MANPNEVNILKSGATVYFAPVGETIPDETSVAAGEDWGGNWARIGYTSDPLVMAMNEERMAIMVEEEIEELREHRTKFVPTWASSFAELTADYLALLFGGTPSTTAAGAGQVGYEELDIEPTGKVQEYAVGFEGVRADENDNDLPVRLFFYKATFKVNGDVEFSKRTDSYSKVPFMLKSLLNPGGTTRKWQRVTAPATS